jgi:LmbE family N-acetylglucosaminyl deacetylase
LKAARRGHRVTLVQAVSTYCSWPVVRGREAEIKPLLARISESTGINLVTLGHDYLRLESRTELITQLSAAIGKAQADVVFCPWEEDHNQDHVAVGAAARIAALHGYDFVADDAWTKKPHQVLQYPLDANTSFRPDTFVNTEDVIFDLLKLSSVFDHLYTKHKDWPDAVNRMSVTDHVNKDRSATLTRQNEYMLGLALVRGVQCGERFADGFKAYNSVSVGKQLLSDLL